MPQLSIAPDRPLDPRLVEVLREISAAAHKLGIPFVLAGATARDLVLQHVYGLAPGPRTMDIDFGLAVADWQQFTNLQHELIRRGKFEVSGRMAQRLFYRVSERQRITVDLIPFAGVENPQGEISWPPDNDVVMNVAGFAEALESALHIQVAEDLVVPVVSLPGLGILKLMAWHDRSDRTNKDAGDLYRLAREYTRAGQEQLIYDHEAELLERYGFDDACAGAHLLGRHCAHIANEETMKRMMGILNDADSRDHLVGGMLLAVGRSDEIFGRDTERLVTAFAEGVLENSKQLTQLRQQQE